MTEIQVPHGVMEIVERLAAMGYEAWCVGGCVRDSLLAKMPKDWDLATNARPADVMRVFSRTVPVGLEHGTVGVINSAGEMLEVTTFREDMATDGRHATVRFSDTIEEDLSRRDFTINAIAYNPVSKVLCDPWHGQEDLADRLVKCVGVAADRMREDRLRAIRAIRFAGRYGFYIDDATWDAVKATDTRHLAAERIWGEIVKMLGDGASSASMKRLADAGVLAAWMPGARLTDIGNRILDSDLSAAGRLCGLFWGVSDEDIAMSLRMVKAPNEEAGAVRHFYRSYGQIEPLAGGSPLRKAAHIIGRDSIGLYAQLRDVVHMDGRGAELLAAADGAITLADLAVNGNMLLGAGLKGPAIGRVLGALLEAVIEKPELNTSSSLMVLVPGLVAQFSSDEGAKRGQRRRASDGSVKR